jgi:hypothetical protein
MVREADKDKDSREAKPPGFHGIDAKSSIPSPA